MLLSFSSKTNEGTCALAPLSLRTQGHRTRVTRRESWQGHQSWPGSPGTKLCRTMDKVNIANNRRGNHLPRRHIHNSKQSNNMKLFCAFTLLSFVSTANGQVNTRGTQDVSNLTKLFPGSSMCSRRDRRKLETTYGVMMVLETLEYALWARCRL